MTINLSRRAFSYFMDACLILLVGAAWAAQTFRELSEAILATTAGFGVGISLIAIRAVRLKDGASDTEMPDKVSSSEKTSDTTVSDTPWPAPVSVDTAERYLSQFRHLSPGAGRWPNVHSRHLSMQSYVFPYFGPRLEGTPKSGRAIEVFDFAPSDPENYTVRVGLVTIRVRSGHTDIEVSSKDPFMYRQLADEKIDVALDSDTNVSRH